MAKRDIMFRAWDGQRFYYFANHAYTLDYNDINARTPSTITMARGRLAKAAGVPKHLFFSSQQNSKTTRSDASTRVTL
jgi:hypothetical protein